MYYFLNNLYRLKLICQQNGAPLVGWNIGIAHILKDTKYIDNPEKSVKPDEESETGYDRLRRMYSRDEYGDTSPEITTVMTTGMMGWLFGSVIGGTIFSKESYLQFFRDQQATAFHSHFEAKRVLQDKVTLGFAKGAIRWGWRLGLFTTSMTLLIATISTYRGKSSVIDYIIGGGATGALFKFNQGPKALVAGGIIGGILGFSAGALSFGLMYVAGTSLEELRQHEQDMKINRQAKEMEALRQARMEDLQAQLPKSITLKGPELTVD